MLSRGISSLYKAAKPLSSNVSNVTLNTILAQHTRKFHSLRHTRVLFNKDASKEAQVKTEKINVESIAATTPVTPKQSFWTLLKQNGVFGVSLYLSLYAGTFVPLGLLFGAKPEWTATIQTYVYEIPYFGEQLANMIVEYPNAFNWILAMVICDMLEVIRIPFVIWYIKRFRQPKTKSNTP